MADTNALVAVDVDAGETTRTASQTLQNDTRAPQNSQTMADANALVAVDVDAGEKTRIKGTVCGDQAGGTEICASTSPARKVNDQESRAGDSTRMLL